MEICQSNFYKNLLDILVNISRASYVTFDFEMSGITTRPKNSPGDRSLDVEKPTLQQQYDEVRSTAETFQILQMGITIVEEVRDKEFYIARPYNFDLSPLSYGGIDIGLQRTIRFNSSSCDFLHSNGFDFGKVFRTGVPYLSRAEESELRSEFELRAERNSKIPDLIIEDADKKASEFCDYIRNTITDWLEKPVQKYVNIGTTDNKLTGFQRRLVHQIVRRDFPNLRTYNRCDGDFMQIEKLNVEQEAIHRKFRLKKFDTKLLKQKGLGWIFEALCGGNLTGIDPLWVYNQQDEEPEKLPAGIATRITDVEAKLKLRNHIIVGHNIFMDLAFLYKTFVGPLPSQVEDFRKEIHRLFPRVIDTKFLATHGLESKYIRSSLKEVLEPFLKVDNPLILLHQDHRFYGSSFGKDHEAGYDSWMTAELFVKLSAKLMTDQKMNGKTIKAEKLLNNHYETCQKIANNDDETNINSYDTSNGIFPTQRAECTKNPYVSSNPFAILGIIEDEQDTALTETPTIQKWLPDFSSKFWTPYINKIRVSSIESCIFDLAQLDVKEYGDQLSKKICTSL
ncbi:putative caf1 family ribonuclease [Erysiphe necator]|uniref:Putative caf1 family ribonuclease n=1 Tax=Uncinula necator TaxID=52586 RepID=A0A0B1P1V0_UNCNE|nr:putative caf1 family ribonuclease [Erysiphe necator]